MGVVLFYLGVQAYEGNTIARWMLFAAVVGASGAVNDTLHSELIIKTAFIGPHTFIAFVLLQSAILSGKAARAFRQAEHLGNNLQKEVELQTQEAIKAKEAAEQLRDKAEAQSIELKELDKQKTHFFQNMSHELRTLRRTP